MEHMPFIPFGQSIPEVLKHLAEGLAAMHLADPPPEAQGEGGREDNSKEMQRCSLRCIIRERIPCRVPAVKTIAPTSSLDAFYEFEP